MLLLAIAISRVQNFIMPSGLYRHTHNSFKRRFSCLPLIWLLQKYIKIHGYVVTIYFNIQLLKYVASYPLYNRRLENGNHACIILNDGI